MIIALLTGETFSNVGNNLFSIAINWYLYKITTNSSIIGIISGLFNATVLGNLFTGWFADRHSRLKIMIWIDVIQLSVTGLAFLIYNKSLLMDSVVIGVEFISQIAGTFFLPAENAIIPQLANASHWSLNQANSINDSLQMMTKIVGLGLGGIFVTIMSLKYIVLINCLTFLISLICILKIKHCFKESAVQSNHSPLKNHWYSGITFIKNSSLLRKIVVIAIAFNFFYSPLMNLEVIWVHQLLHASATVYSSIEISLIIGIIIGSLFSNLSLLQNQNILKLEMLSSLMLGLFLIPIWLFHEKIETVAFVCGSGLIIGLINTFINTFIQKQVPNHLLGRVSGALIAMTNVSIPAGTFIGGLVAQLFGIKFIFIFDSLIFILVSIYLLISTNNIRYAS